MPTYRLRAEQTIVLEVSVDAPDLLSGIQKMDGQWDQWDVVNIGNPRDYRIVGASMPGSRTTFLIVPVSDEEVMVIEVGVVPPGTPPGAPAPIGKVIATLRRR